MPQDIKLFQNDYGYFELRIENGEIVKTSGLDTALRLSIFSRARADGGLIPDPLKRGGHPIDELLGRAIGNLAWVKIQQGTLDAETLNFVESEYTKGLKWLVDDNIAQDIRINLENQQGKLYANITIVGKNAENTYEYNLLVNTK
jgi:phage gp46-like protein